VPSTKPLTVLLLVYVSKLMEVGLGFGDASVDRGLIMDEDMPLCRVRLLAVLSFGVILGRLKIWSLPV